MNLNQQIRKTWELKSGVYVATDTAGLVYHTDLNTHPDTYQMEDRRNWIPIGTAQYQNSRYQVEEEFENECIMVDDELMERFQSREKLDELLWTKLYQEPSDNITDYW